MSNKPTDNNLSEKSLDNGRCGGILLHISSLPGEYGIGDLGPQAYKFVDFLKKYKQNLWQILPLGPIGYGNSPYQCFSAFAGNPIIISPEKLCEVGLLTNKESKPSVAFPELRVDYGRVIPYKWQLLESAFKNFQQDKISSLKSEFSDFTNKQSYWLDDYSLFMSIKKVHNFRAWNEWEENLKFRENTALERWKKEYQNEIMFHKFTQFIFFKQWNEVKSYANLKNIQIIGDMPIFVAYDSVDVWAYPELYRLNEKRELSYVAGVPPDYFSSTGQRWGNPIYNWKALKKLNYDWWIQRIRHNLEQVDILRIDHFRGFESYWQIAASEETAVVGNWIPGPRMDLFLTLKKQLASLPIIAEDLGIITPDVEKLLQQTGFPGMRVLQFAFGDTGQNSSKYLPHNFYPNTIVYTGTHDNQTTKAWYESLSKKSQNYILEYTNSDGKDVIGDLIRLAWSSVANLAVIPLQDLLRLGNKARMNFPGTLRNNWEWRFTWNQITKERGREIRKLSRIYDRI